MNKHFEDYKPQTFNQIVFEEHDIQQQLLGYASGSKRKNILLWGKPGGGKSLIADIIASSSRRENAIFSSDRATVINGDSWNKKSIDMILGAYNTGSSYVVIDEVDELKDSQKELTAFIDRYGRVGKLILTTNVAPASLLQRLVDRCDTIEIKLPTSQSNFAQVRKMFNENGCKHYTDEAIKTLIATTNGSWRQIETMFEDEIYYNAR